MKEKLLLVDDDATLLEFLGEFLENLAYSVLRASNGPDALRITYREHPNLVVLDVMMPGMDGWEVAARIREMADLPIIMVTGKSTEADKLRGFKLGVDDYVTKPIRPDELVKALMKVTPLQGAA